MNIKYEYEHGYEYFMRDYISFIKYAFRYASRDSGLQNMKLNTIFQ